MIANVENYHPKNYLQQLIQTPPYNAYSLDEIAWQINRTPAYLQALCEGEIKFTVDTSIRLGLFFGIYPDEFIKRQCTYDVIVRMNEDEEQEKYFKQVGSSNLPGYQLLESKLALADDDVF